MECEITVYDIVTISSETAHVLCRKTAKSVLSAHVENDTSLEAVSVYLGGSKGNVVPWKQTVVFLKQFLDLGCLK